jgi:hypothetical protein
MLDDSRAMQGLFHALVSGMSPTLERLPSEAAAEGRRVLKDAAGEMEHWLTSTAHVIVCGHTQCGGLLALAEGTSKLEAETPTLAA